MTGTKNMVSLGFVFSLHQSFAVAPNVQAMMRLLFEASSIQSHNERTETFFDSPHDIWARDNAAFKA